MTQTDFELASSLQRLPPHILGLCPSTFVRTLTKVNCHIFPKASGQVFNTSGPSLLTLPSSLKYSELGGRNLQLRERSDPN